MATIPVEVTEATLLSHIAQAQGGASAAVEALLQQFRPLLRARMQQVWAALQDHMPPVEWGDVEAQVQFCFLVRLQKFQLGAGVYFPHYIERMLSLDCRAWVRQQRAITAVPFSQLTSVVGGDDPGEWLADSADVGVDYTSDLDQVASLREALQLLTPPQRETVLECCVLGRTENEVAARLGIARSTVRNRLEGALGRLRNHFQVEVMGAGTVPDGMTSRAISTRTGRGSSRHRRSAAARRLFWLWRICMAHDEKRPDLVGIGAGRPVLLQGTFDFDVTGLKTPRLLSPKLRYIVPAGTVVGIRFFRVGIICDQMVCVSSVVNGLPHRLVPVAANSAIYVPLAIVDPIIAGSEIEIHIAAAAPGTAIVDIGCLQMPA